MVDETLTHRIEIDVLQIMPDGDHICRHHPSGRIITLRPREARVLVTWRPSPREWVEIDDEVYRRELVDIPSTTETT